MKLWMILYAAHGIGGTWGPLPYGLEECEARASEGNQKIASARADMSKPAEIREKVASWKFVCEYHASRPDLASDERVAP